MGYTAMWAPAPHELVMWAIALHGLHCRVGTNTAWALAPHRPHYHVAASTTRALAPHRPQHHMGDTAMWYPLHTAANVSNNTINTTKVTEAVEMRRATPHGLTLKIISLAIIFTYNP